MIDLIASTADGLAFSLLNDPLIAYWHASDGAVVQASLPELFDALTRDQVRDYPALSAHQRRQWHAVLVKLAAVALHWSPHDTLCRDAQAWRLALQRMPRDHHGAAWCLELPPQFLGIGRGLPLQCPAPARDERSPNPTASCGSRWRADVLALLADDVALAEACGMVENGSLSLNWLEPLGLGAQELASDFDAPVARRSSRACLLTAQGVARGSKRTKSTRMGTCWFRRYRHQP
ncbi:hypothetical protein [Aquabacterium sp.]|uniref:hypothetical protein n=1 Tax=Aquabacterium sp. TaxID=1872578 RepID=UPI0035B4630A